MIVWTPIANGDPVTYRGKPLNPPPVSATMIGSNVVLRCNFVGFFANTITVTAIPFDSEAKAAAWIEANRAPEAPSG
jgi:hypothetical protein